MIFLYYNRFYNITINKKFILLINLFFLITLLTMCNTTHFPKKLKLGKEYKDIKLYFIKVFSDYIELEKNNEEKKMINLIETIRLKMFHYLEAFMVVDAYDIINIILKKYRETECKQNCTIKVFNYIENIFNNDLYAILINHIVKKRYLVNSTDSNYKNMLMRNTAMYMGIIKIEILKIILMKSITKDEQELFLKEQNIDLYSEIYTHFWKDMINNTKKTILKYYNDLRTSFSDNKDLINNCKELIVKNNVLVQS